MVDWLTLSKNTGTGSTTVQITASTNDSTEPRSTTLYCMEFGTGRAVKLEVVQQGKPKAICELYVTVAATGGRAIHSINSLYAVNSSLIVNYSYNDGTRLRPGRITLAKGAKENSYIEDANWTGVGVVVPGTISPEEDDKYIYVIGVPKK